MAKIYFKKDYNSVPGLSFGIGCYDSDRTYNDEGKDFLADVLFIELDNNSIHFDIGQDFIDSDDVVNLNIISSEHYNFWFDFFNKIHKQANSLYVSSIPDVHFFVQ